ncbi:hypothetical protein FV228_28185 [Methylobacterium sp. WL18]|uniref:glycosyltransferase family 8 protein n=1 Tax=Methylobacterium sp. WL18 TaxID=2603897 RepID=UPI0011C97E6E|nr:glycosyltransferase [Methylobacterium sp. WL18]TXN53659.1 hypothetical protein FV228_28185 [Methylobacterium sp. WL18]
MSPAINPTVCYVTDVSYLAPTLISISTLRKSLSICLPVVLVLTLRKNEKIEGLEEIIDRLSVRLIHIDHALVDDLTSVWSSSHVSKAALGRLFLHELIPTDINRILYLDGDTFISNDLSGLAFAPIPGGSIGMAEDALSFYRKDNSINGRSTRAYLSKIGLGPDDAYGNSGVMVSSRTDWKALSLDALAYLKHSAERCPPYHDQSAINAVIGSRRANIATKWNFQSRFAQWDRASISKASLWHFTGAQKPWMGSVHPWQSIYGELVDIIQGLDMHNFPLGSMTADEVKSFNSQFNNSSYFLRRYFDFRLLRRPKLIAEYDKACVI